MKLTDTSIGQAKPGQKTIKMFDGAGLFLQVEPGGAKLWRYKYRFDKKEKLIALGTYPEVSLEEARRRHFDARRQIADGIDPMAAKNAAKKAANGTRGRRAENTFESVAREWFEHWRVGKSEEYSGRIMHQLQRDVLPCIGSSAIAGLKPSDVLSVCRRVETRGAVATAHKLQLAISMICQYAVATGRAERDPCSDLKGALMAPKAKPLPILTEPAEVAALLRAIDGYKGGHIVRCALALAALLFVRPGELRNAKWCDIDFEKAEWVFAHSKQRAYVPNKHKLIVPLARQALAILSSLHSVTGGCPYLFPGMHLGRPICISALVKAMHSIGCSTNIKFTADGFLGMASAMLAEQLHIDPRWIERQVRRTTNKRLAEADDGTLYIDERRQMMQTWADYLDELKATK
jgi:integrase